MERIVDAADVLNFVYHVMMHKLWNVQKVAILVHTNTGVLGTLIYNQTLVS